MENAAEALKMSAAVLIFIIAIATSFSIFGTAKQTSDSIITMRDKQAYLESAEVDNGILYTSSTAIKSENVNGVNTNSTAIKSSNVNGVNTNGDRLVGKEDVYSTIYRYAKEKYGVTIMNTSGKIYVRFDSNTENVMRQYDKITEEGLNKYLETLKSNLKTSYVSSTSFTKSELENLYKLTNSNGRTTYGAPWYGNDEEIQKRINFNINGGTYENNGQSYTIENSNCLNKILDGKTIIEVVNEIDQSKYLSDGDQKTDLLQQYTMPTVEIIYIIAS